MQQLRECMVVIMRDDYKPAHAHGGEQVRDFQVEVSLKLQEGLLKVNHCCMIYYMIDIILVHVHVNLPMTSYLLTYY